GISCAQWYVFVRRRRFSVASEKDGFLTLVALDPEGGITLLLPNAWQKTSLVRAGRIETVPAEGAEYRYPIRPPHGTTRVRAIVSARSLSLEGVTDERIARERFVGLGNVRAAAVEGAPGLLRTKPSDAFKADEWAAVDLDVVTRAPETPKPEEPSVSRPPALPSPSPDARDACERLLERWETIRTGGAKGVASAADTPVARGVGAIEPVEEAIVFYKTGAGAKGPAPEGPFKESKRIVRLAFAGERGVGGADLMKRLRSLEEDPNVLAAVPNVRMRAFAEAPTLLDPVHWELQNPFLANCDSGATRAEALAVGIEPALVGVVDQGLHTDDPRLAALAWANPGEVPGNGLDDDSDGFVDDVNGWNFVENTSRLYVSGAPFSHGSAVSGVIAGRPVGHPLDVRGIAPRARIVSAVVLDPRPGSKEFGSGDWSRIRLGILYVVARGARVVNLSLGGVNTPAGLAALSRDPIWEHLQAQDVLVVAAAGNDALDIDVTPVTPACVVRPNLVCVVAVDPAGRLGRGIGKTGRLETYSNFGARWTHLGAPGSFIPVAVCKDRAALACGTSFSAPLVSGAAALVRGKHPDWSAERVIKRLLDTARPAPDLQRRCATGGILDLEEALKR
ncbi:MAG: S8 family serine peptidase, partial [Planctomycetota bacterium]